MLNNRIVVNLISKTVQFVTGLVISFFLSPFIIRSVGIEAYGFYAMAGTFISYISLATIAINSMASTFITIEWHKGNIKKANEFFNTVLFANLFISLILTIVVFACTIFLDRLIVIPEGIVASVKWLFVLILLSGIVSTGGSVFSTAIFCANRLDLGSYAQIIVSLLRVILLLILFLKFEPNILYLGVASFFCSLIEVAANVSFTKKLMSKIAISFVDFKKELINDVVVSGIWNLVNQVNTILLVGLDLIIANIFFGSTVTGVLAISKVIPNMLFSLFLMIGNVFLPQLTIAYARKNKDELEGCFESSFSIMGFISSIITAGFLVFGEAFYKLWLPMEEASTLYILSILAMLSTFSIASTQTVLNINVFTNTLKLPVLIASARAVIGLIITYFIIKNTNYGIYAIAGMTSILGLLFDLLFHIPYSASCIGYTKWFFYLPKIKMLIVTIVLIFLFYSVQIILVCNSWMTFFVAVLISCIIGTILNSMIYLNKRQREALFRKHLALFQYGK